MKERNIQMEGEKWQLPRAAHDVLVNWSRMSPCLILHCGFCGQGWSPMLLEGGRLRRGYWKCPNGCHD